MLATGVMRGVNLAISPLARFFFQRSIDGLVLKKHKNKAYQTEGKHKPKAVKGQKLKDHRNTAAGIVLAM